MSTEQLQRDLERRVRDRLRQWASDSIQLYEMADLEDKAAATVMTTLLWFMSVSFAKLGFSPERAAQLLCEDMREMQQKQKRRGKP